MTEGGSNSEFHLGTVQQSSSPSSSSSQLLPQKRSKPVSFLTRTMSQMLEKPELPPLEPPSAPVSSPAHSLDDDRIMESPSTHEGRHSVDPDDPHQEGVSNSISIHETSPNLRPNASQTHPPRPLPLIRRLSIKPSMTLENSGSVARDHLASERTFLAYVRTSLAIASTGVALVQLFTISSHTATSTTTFTPTVRRIQAYAQPLGATIVCLGIAVLFIGESFSHVHFTTY